MGFFVIPNYKEDYLKKIQVKSNNDKEIKRRKIMHGICQKS